MTGTELASLFSNDEEQAKLCHELSIGVEDKSTDPSTERSKKQIPAAGVGTNCGGGMKEYRTTPSDNMKAKKSREDFNTKSIPNMIIILSVVSSFPGQNTKRVRDVNEV
eukprot:CAMPEP_0116832956 /NCGR_PEP_ID=MMETSP0418-20121206/6174_1 /TAXON_ID=1158023 /ORGANISM="Astrosyne radiata, Strain 13vi08-1A" /LENGTH=108 /DNA_ID=CAMNT_0004462363 /DNA_START=279 /DNA_END=603 /DNA_ORIENTATION=+